MKFIRSIYRLGDFNDNEVYDLEKEPSLTDPSQDETIQDLVDRMIRGELLQNTKVPQYDITDENAQGDPFAALPVTATDGFDLSDAPVILDSAAQALSDLNKPAPVPVVPKEPEAPAQL